MNRSKAVTWEESCLAKFSKFLGLPIKGFEGKFMDMVKRIRLRQKKGRDKGTMTLTKFDREIKKTGVVYKGKGREDKIGLKKGKGSSKLCC